MDKKTQFDTAVQQHQLAHAMFGPDDPRTIEAIHLVMLLAPDDVFEAIEEMARSTFH